jgi:hypothetical protein
MKKLLVLFAVVIFSLSTTSCFDKTGAKDFLKRYQQTADQVISFATAMDKTFTVLEASGNLMLSPDAIKAGTESLQQLTVLETEWETKHKEQASKGLQAKKAKIDKQLQENEFIKPQLLSILMFVLKDTEMMDKATKIYAKSIDKLNKITKRMKNAAEGSAEQEIAMEDYNELKDPFAKTGVNVQQDLYRKGNLETFIYGFYLAFFHSNYFENIPSTPEEMADFESNLTTAKNTIIAYENVSLLLKNITEDKVAIADFSQEENKAIAKLLKDYTQSIIKLKKRINVYMNIKTDARVDLAIPFYAILARAELNKFYSRMLSVQILKLNFTKQLSSNPEEADALKEKIKLCDKTYKGYEKLTKDSISFIREILGEVSIYRLDTLVNDPVYGEKSKIENKMYKVNINYRELLK